jgi:20S proteasome alpha/beta subunit
LTSFVSKDFAQLGSGTFERLAKRIDEFDLGISLIVFGFDSGSKTIHLFKVENPGKAVDQDIFGYSVTGSGYFMAMASLNERPMRASSQEEVCYRLCEAKFCAETATAVGRMTTVAILDDNGDLTQLTSAEIIAIRSAWQESRATPIPESAANTIREATKRKLAPKYKWPVPAPSK